MKKEKGQLLAQTVLVLGMAMVSVGVGMLSIPAGMITGGLMTIAAAVLAILGGDSR